VLRLALVGSLLWLQADGATREIEWWWVIGQAWLGAALWSAMDWMSLERRPDP